MCAPLTLRERCIPALGVAHDGRRLLVLVLGLDSVLDAMSANSSRVLLVILMVDVCCSSSVDTPRSGVGRYKAVDLGAWGEAWRVLAVRDPCR